MNMNFLPAKAERTGIKECENLHVDLPMKNTVPSDAAL